MALAKNGKKRWLRKISQDKWEFERNENMIDSLTTTCTTDWLYL